ncbi:hypothetical protein C8R47DRAFT_569616 [Mycena vitilis]|nr:hypothetical protein C8R47DRAFT_569616 [Mycena vitilis]
MSALRDLSEDAALLILEACDITTVLSMGQVNVFFHRLTLSKQLWISLVENLAERFLLDLPFTRSLAELSLDELVGLVKRTVVGPGTWCPGTSPSVVEQISTPRVGLAEKVELLPGGRHLVAQFNNRIEIWNVEGDTPLWSRPCEWDTGYAFEMLEGGRSVVLFLAMFESLHVIQVPLYGKESHDLFDLRLPANCGVETNIRPVVLGDLLVQAICCRGRPAVHAFLLVDWRLQKYVLIRYFPPVLPLIWHPVLALAPGHLIFTLSQGVTVYATAAFEEHWRVITSLTDKNFSDFPAANVAPSIIAPLPLSTPPSGSPPNRMWNPTLALHRSPLRQDGYKLLVHHTGDTLRVAKSAVHVLFDFRFSVSPETGAIEGWTLASAVPAVRITPLCAYMSYAGYSVRSVTEGGMETPPETIFSLVNVRSLPSSPGLDGMAVLSSDSSLGLSPYSHARLHRQGMTMVISHYL